MGKGNRKVEGYIGAQEEERQSNEVENRLTDKKKVEGSESMKLKFLNTQGLTQTKMIEIEQLLDNSENCLICLVETHQVRDNIYTYKDSNTRSSFRKAGEKKGGGIQLVWSKNSKIHIVEESSVHSDLMFAKVEVGMLRFFLVVTYFATNDRKTNEDLTKEIGKFLKSKENDKVMMVGDFNAHLGILGTQKVNDTGKKVLKMREEHNLNILNLDPRCKGVKTWSRGDINSAIDFAICNENCYEHFIDMQIDEDKQVIEWSDHNLIEIKLRYKSTKAKKETQIITFSKRDEKDVGKFVDQVEEEVGRMENVDMESLNSVIKKAQETHLKVTIERKKEKRVRPKWFTRDIEKGIAKRRAMNKKHRNEFNPRIKLIYKRKYLQLKKMVQISVREAIENYEVQLTKKIKEDKNRGKRIWKHIKDLKHDNYKDKQEFIYDENKKKITEKEKIKETIEDFWVPLYQSKENQITRRYNSEHKVKYMDEFINNNYDTGYVKEAISIEQPRWIIDQNEIITPIYSEINIHKSTTEQYECAMKVKRRINSMELEPRISIEEVTKQIKGLKNGKAPGPDEITPELYKSLINSPNIIEKITESLNKILEQGKVPDSWKSSNTKLIPKNKQPMADQMRPIALTDISYKILMGILKCKIENHLEKNKAIKDMQSGGTPKRRVTENIFIFNYLIEKCAKIKKNLFVTSIDFKKAYDSIDRFTMIKVMEDYKISPKIINLIANIYNGDKTALYLNNEMITEVDITTGIRQGCNLSGLLFVLVTYKIIEELNASDFGIKIDNINHSTLFYMDDALLFTKDEISTYTIIERMGRISLKYGLSLNKKKCKVMIFNNENIRLEERIVERKEGIESIHEIEISKTIKYLGVNFDNKSNCFETHIQEMHKKAECFSSQLFSILGKSCNRMIKGKTFWKGLVIPNLLYANDVIVFNKKELDKLQVYDNKAYRQILKVPCYTAVSFLRGEVGASSSVSRDMKSKILFLKHCLEENKNAILKEIVMNEKDKKSTKWFKSIGEYLRKLNLNFETVSSGDREVIEKRIKEWDTNVWREEMVGRKTLEIYRRNKVDIAEEKWFRNGSKYSIMMRARSNTLELGWRERQEGEKTCKLCRRETETLEHFILDCSVLEQTRKNIVDKLTENFNRDETIRILLMHKACQDVSQEDIIKLVSSMYSRRYAIIEILKG